MTTTVGFVGLGAMGAPMAARLAATGRTVQGYDPFAPATPTGVRRVDTARDAAAGAEVVVLMVATPEQARDALGGETGVLRSLQQGAVVLVTATVGPDAVTALAGEVAAAGGELVDAPVSGGVVRAADGELTLMVSGSPAAIDRTRGVIDALGGTVFVLTDTAGDGQRMKLVNQLLAGVHIAVAGEALAYARALGIDPARAFEVVSSGAAASFMLDDRGRRMVAEAFDEPRSAVDIFVKDLSLVTGAARFPLPIAEAALDRFRAASAAGLGRKDDSAVITTYESYHREDNS